MPNLLLTIKYKGTHYHGWQVQKNALSVQEVLQNAIEDLYGERLDVKGCSRTDTGVHANMFCVSFFAPFYAGEYKTLCAINNRLPEDIKAYRSQPVPDDFHARYSSVGKEYVYYIYDEKYPDPFLSDYSLHYRQRLDTELMNKAASYFIGTHDFAGFCSSKSDVEDTVRTIYSCSVSRENGLIKVQIHGDGFLYNMVRIIVGTLIDVSRGKILLEDIPEIILSGKRNRAGKTAPAKGLFLNKVYYGDIDFES